MMFFKYPLFMKRKEKEEQLTQLLLHINKKRRLCPICKYKYRKGESGESYSIPSVENPRVYPRDFIDGVCPVCHIEEKKDEYDPSLVNKVSLELMKRIILWRYDKDKQYIKSQKGDKRK